MSDIDASNAVVTAEVLVTNLPPGFDPRKPQTAPLPDDDRLAALEDQNAALLAKLATATTLAQVRKAAADIIAEG